MRILILFPMLFCSWAVLHAQGIYYSYDAAGNRTGNLSYFSANSLEDGQLQEGDEANGLSRSRYHVTAVPNPTRGYLQVQVMGLEEGDACQLSLYDVSGRRVLSCATSRVLTTLDLTAVSPGLYLLRVDVNDETETLKIIKEDC